MKRIDIFISYGREDEASAALPLAKALEARHLRVWYDRFDLRLGDSLRHEIDRGLSAARFGVVILSPAFFAKPFPQLELDALFAREAKRRVKVLLPVWHQITHDEVLARSPLLAGKFAVSTDREIEAVADEIVSVLRPERSGRRSLTRGARTRPIALIKRRPLLFVATALLVAIGVALLLFGTRGDSRVSRWPPGMSPTVAQRCREEPGTLCFLDGRFRAQATWIRDGTTSVGVARSLQDGGGVFAEASGDGPGLALRILDARKVNTFFWVIVGKPSNAGATLTITDQATGAVKDYPLPAQEPVQEPRVHFEISPFTPPPGDCVERRDELCLLDGRMKLRLACFGLAGEELGVTAVHYSPLGGFFRCSDVTLDLVVSLAPSANRKGVYRLEWAPLTQADFILKATQISSGEVRTFDIPADETTFSADIAAFSD